MSYNVYQRILFFGHHHYNYHFVKRVDRIYYSCPLKKNRIPYKHFVFNAIPILNLRRELLTTFYFVIQTQIESATDKLNVPTNVLDVPTDLARTKTGRTPPCAPFGYANENC